MKTRLLPCVLTEDQIRERGIELAALEQELDQIGDAKKTANAGFKEQIEAINERKGNLVKEINSKMEWRDVVVTEDKNFEKKEGYTIRTDTGEIVSTRILHPEELQRPIPFGKTVLEAVAAEINSGVMDDENCTITARIREAA